MEEKDYLFFEDYLSGSLNKDNEIAFEKRLENDTAFKNAFTTYKELSGFLEHEIGNETETASFKNNLESISSTYFKDKVETQRVAKTTNFYKYAIAASFVFLFGIFMFNQFSNPSYSEFMTYDKASFTVRGNEDAIKLKAENAFNAKDYKLAEVLFNEILKTDSLNLEIELYKSVTLIETERYSEADELLWNLSETNSAFKNKAKWYWALSKLRQKDFKASAEIVKTIPQDAEDYNRAQKLLRELD